MYHSWPMALPMQIPKRETGRERNLKQQLLCTLLNARLVGAHFRCKKKSVKTEEYLLPVFIKEHAHTFQTPLASIFGVA